MMNIARPLVFCLLALLLCAQKREEGNPLPVATQWTLDAAGATQRSAISYVFLLVCKTTEKKGTSFLLSTGLVISNEHVVRGCDSQTLYGVTPKGEQITFSKIITDANRDLALLRPTKALSGGLELGTDDALKLGVPVTTWGFPLIYNGPAPLLSVGYVAGYNAVNIGDKTVKHIVVNGAFNPGNSGGPVFLSNENKVLGVVVWKQTLFSRNLPILLEGVRHPNVILSSGITMTMPDGSTRGLSQQEAVAMILDEFYNTVQVMIGEAISVEELRAFISERKAEMN